MPLIPLSVKPLHLIKKKNKLRLKDKQCMRTNYCSFQVRVRSFGLNSNPDFESKNGFSVPLGKSKKGFQIH